MQTTTKRIRARRQDLGYTQREVASEIGVSATTIRSLETGNGLGQLPVSKFQRLCELLGVSCDFILNGVSPEPTGVVTDDDLMRIIGSVLLQARRKIVEDALADALGVNRGQLVECLQALDEKVRPAGLRVHRRDHFVQLVAEPLGDRAKEVLDASVKKSASLKPLSPTEAKILVDVMEGTAKARTVSAKNPRRVALRRLVNAGYVAEYANEEQPLELTIRLRAALLQESDASCDSATERSG